jgi:peptidyl-prolyl cis-trans isomerase-like protein 2
MGKKQHQKDKMYLTTTEWTTLYGGKRAAQKPGKDPRAEFRRLPFNHCSLSLQPFEVPYCCEDGAIFDLLSVLPYLKKYGHHPLTGKVCMCTYLYETHGYNLY